MKLQILLTRKFFQQDIDYIKTRLLPDCEVIIPEEYTEKSLLKYAGEMDVFLGNFLSEGLLRNARKLRLIQIPWTGVDNLDFNLLSKFKVTVCNSHSNSGIIAEHAIAMLLALLKKIPYHHNLLKDGLWNRPEEGMVQRSDVDIFSDTILYKTIALIGYGAIGRKIRQYLSGFDLRFIATNNFNETDNCEELDQITTPDNLDVILSQADVVFVTVPLTPETENLIDRVAFQHFKSSAFLVNISRSRIVNEEALYEALVKGRIRGAAIDTWYQYPGKSQKQIFPSKFPIHTLHNVLLSPHRAGFVKDTLPHLDDAIDNINNLAQEKTLKNVVNIKNRY